MNRRNFIIAGASLPFAGYVASAIGAESPQLVAVKFLSFMCPVCYQSEGQEALIRSAIMDAGGRHVRAPLMSSQTDQGFMARTYYASRQMGFEFSENVVKSFFKACHDVNIYLESFADIYTWLDYDFSGKVSQDKIRALLADAQGPDAQAAYNRAILLAKRSSVDALPSYVFLINDKIVGTADPSIYSGGAAILREGVIKKIKELSSSK